MVATFRLGSLSSFADTGVIRQAKWHIHKLENGIDKTLQWKRINPFNHQGCFNSGSSILEPRPRFSVHLRVD